MKREVVRFGEILFEDSHGICFYPKNDLRLANGLENLWM